MFWLVVAESTVLKERDDYPPEIIRKPPKHLISPGFITDSPEISPALDLCSTAFGALMIIIFIKPNICVLWAHPSIQCTWQSISWSFYHLWLSKDSDHGKGLKITSCLIGWNLVFQIFFFRFVYCHKTHSDTYRLYQVYKIQYDTGNIRNKSTSNIFISHTLFLLLDHWKEKNIWNIVWLTSQSTTVQLLEGKQKYPTTVVFVTNKNFCNINQVHYLQQKTNNQVI